MALYYIDEGLLNEVKDCIKAKIDDDASEGFTEAAEETAELLARLNKLTCVEPLE